MSLHDVIGYNYLRIEAPLLLFVLDGLSRLHDIDLLVTHGEALPSLHHVLTLGVDTEDGAGELQDTVQVLVPHLDTALPPLRLLLVGQDVDPGEPGLVPLLKHGEEGVAVVVVPDDSYPGADLPLLKLVLEEAGQSEVSVFLVVPDQGVIMLVLDVREDLPDLEPGQTLGVGAGHLPAPALPLVLSHGVPQLHHLAPLVVVLAVHLQLVVLDHFLYLEVPVGRVGVQAVSLRTSSPGLSLPICRR